jgi:hypothetical protein
MMSKAKSPRAKADEAIERVAEKIAHLDKPEIRSELVLSLVDQVPYIGGPFATWLSHGQREASFARLEEALWAIHDGLAELAVAQEPFYIDEEYVELVGNILPVVMRTRNERKRARFATLLVTAARGGYVERREEGRTMALLLDQLEYPHISVLDRLVRTPEDSAFTGTWGPTRMVRLKEAGLNLEADRPLLLRLESLGLLWGEFFLGDSDSTAGRLPGQAIITPLGIQLQTWITATPGTRS